MEFELFKIEIIWLHDSLLVTHYLCLWAMRKVCLVAQSCLTLWDPMDYSLPGSSVHGDSPGNNTGVGFHSFLQGLLPTQGSNPSLPHCRQVLYRLKPQGSPKQALLKRRCLCACSEVCKMKVGQEAEQIKMQALVPPSRVCVM